MSERLKLLAYARRRADAPPIAEQIARVEAWTTAQRHTLMKIQASSPDAAATEFPALDQVLAAAGRGEINAVGVVDLAAFGSTPQKIVRVMHALDGKAHVVVVSPERVRILNGASGELTSVLEIATALHTSWVAEKRRDRPRRVCPVRVAVDLDRVLELQGEGRTLEEISRAMNVSRPTISRRLSRAREGARHDQNGQ